MNTVLQPPPQAPPEASQMVPAEPPLEQAAATSRKTAEERKELLARQIQSAAAQGGRVETQSDFQAIVVNGKPVNHTLHGLVSLFTLGLWLPVWLIFALAGGEKREMRLVDEWGNPSIQRL